MTISSRALIPGLHVTATVRPLDCPSVSWTYDPRVMDRCARIDPLLTRVNPEQQAACLLYDGADGQAAGPGKAGGTRT